jgi:hypothetical protein
MTDLRDWCENHSCITEEKLEELATDYELNVWEGSATRGITLHAAADCDCEVGSGSDVHIPTRDVISILRGGAPRD